MKPDWQQSLKAMGERSQIYQEMHREVSGDPAQYRIFDSKAHGEVIEGRLAVKGLADELGDRYYCIVETPKGNSFYVKLDMGMNPEEFREGEIVSIRSERESWLKPTDTIIAEQASKNGGRYDREQHLKERQEHCGPRPFPL